MDSRDLAPPGPHEPNSALLIVDMISDFEFEDGEKLFENTKKIVRNVSDLRRRAKEANVPVIYVNDNFGRWNEDFRTYIKNVKERSAKARGIVELIEPDEEDYFILKPQRSGFYATALGVLLISMNVSRVIVAGATTDICVLFTAHDAYMRGYSVCVPADCCAAVEHEHHVYSLKFLERVAEADTSPQAAINFTDQSFAIAQADPDSEPSDMRNVSSEFRLENIQ